jgi:hypothetical protein
MSSESDALRRVLEVLDLLEIPYMLCGSMASSLYGIPRTSFDVDLIANLHASQVDEFGEALKDEFYLDKDTIREALDRTRSFHLIHSSSVYKVDIFPLQQDDYSQTEFARRCAREVRSLEGEPFECVFATAEDTILSKLHWYRAGGETSERQWHDLLGILHISGATLDLAYLDTWAPRIGVADLLESLQTHVTIRKCPTNPARLT